MTAQELLDILRERYPDKMMRTVPESVITMAEMVTVQRILDEIQAEIDASIGK